MGDEEVKATKLLPCPFCGSDAVLSEDSGAGDDETHEPAWHVTHVICGNDECPVFPSVLGEDIEADAIRKWNTRTNPAHDALVVALAYAIRNAVANGAKWSPDITDWADSLKSTHPDRVAGGDLVRAALKLAEQPEVK